MAKSFTSTIRFLGVLLWGMLAACGGGGGGGGAATEPTPPPPAATPTPSLSYGIKELRFTWLAVSGATHYRLFENPDGRSGYTQVGSDFITTSINHTIALYRRINARYIISACNGGGCTDSAPISLAARLIPAIGYVKGSNTRASNYFGDSVALSADGNTLAVGAPGESIMDIVSGAVYVFSRSGSTWSRQAVVRASNAGAGDYFGGSVTLSADGNTLAVSATGEDSSATGINGNQLDNSATGSGAVYVFTLSFIAIPGVPGSFPVWNQQAYMKASNTDAGDGFGGSIALSDDGNALAVGVPNESASDCTNGPGTDNSARASGAVYTFVRTAEVWTQNHYVKACHRPGDYVVRSEQRFGSSVALDYSGSLLAVGTPGDATGAIGINTTLNGDANDRSAPASGAVYLFRRGTIDSIYPWVRLAYIKPSNTRAGDRFGSAVALSLSGNTLAAGTNMQYGGPYTQPDDLGAAYVFNGSSSGWSQQAIVRGTHTEAGDYFGISVALSDDGNTLAVGDHGESSNATGINGSQIDNSANLAGAAYIFSRSSSGWSQQAYVKASNTGAGDRFGGAVALAGNGNTLAVGAYSEGSNATGIGGNQDDNTASYAGAVYLY